MWFFGAKGRSDQPNLILPRTTENGQRTTTHSCLNASTGFNRAARNEGTIVARNETTSEKAAITDRSMPRVTNGIDETKYTSAISGGNDRSRKRVMIQQITTPRMTPVAVPTNPTIAPYQRKIPVMIRDSAPIDRRIPISFRFSWTVMISVETMLNVDTKTIRPMTTNSTSC